jgi:hypothetical protein
LHTEHRPRGASGTPLAPGQPSLWDP